MNLLPVTTILGNCVGELVPCVQYLQCSCFKLLGKACFCLSKIGEYASIETSKNEVFLLNKTKASSQRFQKYTYN
ncbi:hypothetical protein HZS_7728 [Henneguya salminicola]|nr:hypothetical protein HZS_7728 [Henneguya salminicola]